MTPFVNDPDFTLYCGDVREVLPRLPAESIDCALTSPPFYGLRDYQVDGQIGLEATPDEWADELVGVFREVRRVLKPTGTLFVECGDSYDAGTRVDRQPRPQGKDHGYWENGEINRRIRGEGTKAKDLIGGPWLLAFALRGPWYIGRIKKDVDRVWLAAMVDAEGCIHIHRRKAGTSSGAKFTRKDGTTVNYERKNDTFGVMVSVSNTSRAIVDNCNRIYGRGSLDTHEAGTGVQQRKQSLHRWTVTGEQARDLLRELYPHLVAKQHEARLALGCPTANGGEYQEAIKLLHNGCETTLDANEPPGLWEPGFYLRQAIIWAKSNAMPESAKDRCTTAHSYVFLLSKSPRYWFDSEAIAEPAEWARWGDQTVPKYEGTDSATGWMQPKSKTELLREQRRGTATYESGGLATGRARLSADGGGEATVGPGLKNPRSVWTIPTEGFPEAHFATWPQALVERIIKAGCPEGGTVLDPFTGSGTTALVARRLGRKSIGIELNESYAEMAARRLGQQSLLAGAGG